MRGCRSRAGRWDRGPCGRRRRTRALFPGRAVVWIGTLCPRLEIRGTASVGCTFVTPVRTRILLVANPKNKGYNKGYWIWQRTLKSSHVVNFLTPSPTSLNPSLASSKRSCTLSRTLSVSLFVPRRFSCCERRPILDVRENSCSDRDSLNRLNSGSSRYSGSSLRRYVVGLFVRQYERVGDISEFRTWLSRAGDRSKDMVYEIELLHSEDL